MIEPQDIETLLIPELDCVALVVVECREVEEMRWGKSR